MCVCVLVHASKPEALRCAALRWPQGRSVNTARQAGLSTLANALLGKPLDKSMQVRCMHARARGPGSLHVRMHAWATGASSCPQQRTLPSVLCY